MRKRMHTHDHVTKVLGAHKGEWNWKSRACLCVCLCNRLRGFPKKKTDTHKDTHKDTLRQRTKKRRPHLLAAESRNVNELASPWSIRLKPYMCVCMRACACVWVIVRMHALMCNAIVDEHVCQFVVLQQIRTGFHTCNHWYIRHTQTHATSTSFESWPSIVSGPSRGGQ